MIVGHYAKRGRRAATDQRDEAAGAGRAEHGIALEVAPAQAPLNDFGAVANASRSARCGLFAATRARIALQSFRNLVLQKPPIMQLRYPITFFLRKMTSHRWGLRSQEVLSHTHPLETPSDAFQNLTLSLSSIAFQISDRRVD